MVQYLSKFSPGIAELAEPLQDLMKKHAPYAWGPEHNQAFNNNKKEIVQAPILRYYDPKKETVLQTDASIKGLRACLQPGWTPCLFCKSVTTRCRTWICCHRVRSLSSSMGDGEIPSFLICLTLHFRNQLEAVRNHSHKELDRSNTTITTMTSYTYLPL